MEIKDATFEQIREIEPEGLVLLGCGGDLSEWIDGVSKLLKDEGIADSEFQFTEAFKLTTTGGRVDLLLLFDWAHVWQGKLTIWRIKFGDCSWLSDYKVNYAEQHGFEEDCPEEEIWDWDEEDWTVND